MTIEEQTRRKRTGVIICGAYGMGNAGDEAILEAIISEMRGIDPAMDICVLSRDPEGVRQKFRTDAIHTFNIFGFMQRAKNAALYINGGGSLIQDVTSKRSLWFYLWTLRAAKKRGCRVMMYGCGIGPVIHEDDIARTRRAINRYVDAITLREPDSLDELKRFGVTEPEMILASDPALVLEPAPDEDVERAMLESGVAPDGDYVVFALRRWPGFEEKAPEFSKAAAHICEKHGLTPLFLSINHINDGDASARVIAGLSGTPHRAMPGPLPPGLAIGIMKRARLVVSMRLHGLIFAAVAGIPSVGVSYDPKVTSFLRCVESGCIELSELSAEALCALADSALRQSASGGLEEKIARMKALENRNTETARKLLGKDV